MNNPVQLVLLVIVATALGACGGGGGGGGGATAGPTTDTGNSAPQGLLKPAETESDLAAALKKGLSGASYVSSESEFITLDDANLSASPEAGEASAVSGGNFSQTNLQEQGVDEADIVKYDGEVLYVVDYLEPEFPTPLVEPGAEEPASLIADSSIVAPQTPIIRLFTTDPEAPSTEEVAQISLDSEEASIDGLYLHSTDAAKQLVSVGQTNAFVYWGLFASDYYWRNGKTHVRSWDVSNASAPVSAWSLELDGSLLSSRRIGDTLYLVTRYSPAVEGVVSYPGTEEQVQANQELIEQTPLEDLLPDVRDSQGNVSELLAPTDCMVANEDYEDAVLPPGEGSLITVSAIDLTAPQAAIQSLCLNTYASGFYASSEAIYVTANIGDNTTLIHKVQLGAAGPQYRGSGEVPGYIGTGNPAFLMSEFEGDLRVVSSTWDDRVFPLPVIEPELIEDSEPVEAEQVADESFGRHRLTVLRESADGTRLEQIAQLPNSDRPAVIGKPDEDVFSARFLGDRAYIVTFRVIDPLYVVDLSNPEDPVIGGELEIPGFSTLLQPVGENLLLGVGQEVPDDGQGIVQGVKLALFDVGNVSQPVALSQVVIGKRGSYSPALNNHHSLTLLEVEGNYRAAIPVERHDEDLDNGEGDEQPWRHYGWSDSGLYLFEINPGAGTLDAAGTVIIETASEEQPYSTRGIYNSRSVLHDEAVLFINSGEIWSATWGQ